MKVNLLSHSRLSFEYETKLIQMEGELNKPIEEGKLVAFHAIRNCYSPNKPQDVLDEEGYKYLSQEAKDGEGGTDMDRLIRHIVRSGHTSTLEHLSFTFLVSGVSRALMGQITRHRIASYSIQSQRYVSFHNGGKADGFDYVTPHTIEGNEKAKERYEHFMETCQLMYNSLRKLGIPAEDARYVLPNGATTNIVMTFNLRSLLEFYSVRNEGTHAQWEIAKLAEKLVECVTVAEPWTKVFFEEKKNAK